MYAFSLVKLCELETSSKGTNHAGFWLTLLWSMFSLISLSCIYIHGYRSGNKQKPFRRSDFSFWRPDSQKVIGFLRKIDNAKGQIKRERKTDRGSIMLANSVYTICTDCHRCFCLVCAKFVGQVRKQRSIFLKTHTHCVAIKYLTCFCRLFIVFFCFHHLFFSQQPI